MLAAQLTAHFLAARTCCWCWEGPSAELDVRLQGRWAALCSKPGGVRVVGRLLRLTQSFLGPRSPLCISLVSAPRTNLSKQTQPCPVPLQDSSRPLSPAWGASEPQCLCVGVFPTQSLAPATTAPFCWPRGPVLKCWRGTSALPDSGLTASLLLPLSCLLLSGFGSVACGVWHTPSQRPRS